MGCCWSAPSPTPPAPQPSTTCWVPVTYYPVEERKAEEEKEQEEEEDEEQEEEEDEEQEEETCHYPPLPHPDYNPWPWSPALPCPAMVEYWSETNGVVLTEAQLKAWEKIAKEYNLKNEY